MKRFHVVLKAPAPCTCWNIHVIEGRTILEPRFLGGYQTRSRATEVCAAMNADPECLKHLRNLRFWDFIHDGWVKITLRPGQKLRHETFSRDEEGWSSEGLAWEHSGTGVTESYGHRGRDCDGMVSGGGSCYCPADRLAAIEPYDPLQKPGEPSRLGFLRPDWRKEEAWQRDLAAEAAGY